VYRTPSRVRHGFAEGFEVSVLHSLYTLVAALVQELQHLLQVMFLNVYDRMLSPHMAQFLK
jgi:hypothetical protein